jgi:hypothetical protein
MHLFTGIHRATGIFFCLFSLAAPAACTQSCNNDTVIQAAKMGLQSSMIVKAIKGQKCSFDTSLPALANLKTAGVSDEVIAAMQDMASPPPAAAISPAPAQQQYGQPETAGMAPQEVAIFGTGATPQALTRIDRNALDSGKLLKKSLTMGLTFGVKGVFTPDKDSVAVPGESSDVHVNAGDGIYLVANGVMVNPDSVFLFKAEPKKDYRLICKTKGRMSSIDELVGDKVPIKVTRGASGQAYRIEPVKPLARGEYGLVLDRSALSIWAFGIQ